MAPTYNPLTRRTCGGDEFEVASGGVLELNTGGALSMNGTNVITTGGGIALASLTSGDVTFPGAVTISSGLSVDVGSTFSSGVTIAGLGTFSSGITVAAGSTFSTGIKVTGAGTFSTGIIVDAASTFSSGVTIKGAVSLTSGLTVTGNISGRGFIGSVTVGTSSGGAPSATHLLTVKSTAGEPVVYTVVPQTGYVMYIRCAQACATTGAAIVTTTGTWDGSNKNMLFSSGNSNPQFIGVLGISTSRWQVLSSAYSTDITFTNT